ncbi:MAG: hypothetical protein K2X73_04665 [Sphingomonas sp.]|uniref:hypothetical protein n=1 Tax=Sphingomonas sp. TaxID=28214 RepID=UPI0025E7ACD4|nr:hypothetical protein [Sphingomonas sp.]MBX9881246.1 hypothetical protein [Sphingomonas sp.]
MSFFPKKMSQIALLGSMRTLVCSPCTREQLGLSPGLVGAFVGVHRAIDTDHLPPELHGFTAMLGHVDSHGTASYAVFTLKQLDALEAKVSELRAAILAEERAQRSVQ